MSNIDEKYYLGFEGEPEIIFTVVQKNNEKREIGMWEGYFDKIIKQIEPKDGKWVALAYYYHLDIGWYEESPWVIENLPEVYDQLGEINKENLECIEQREVLDIILSMLRGAIDNNDKVFISYE